MFILHIKSFCIEYNTVFIYYRGNRAPTSVQNLICPFCKSYLSDIPSDLRKNPELYDSLFKFFTELLDQKMKDDSASQKISCMNRYYISVITIFNRKILLERKLSIIKIG